MKKVSVVTIIDNNNFGTFLQAFALCKSIEDLGCIPQLVDYCRPFQTGFAIWKENCKGTINPVRIFMRAIRALKRIKLHNEDRKFIAKYLTSKTCYSIDDIKKSIEPADVYMTGSDQVWNSIHNKGIDRVFYLCYAPQEAKKVAYAASIGVPQFQEWEKRETHELLKSYSYITLREKSSIQLLSSLGIDDSKLKTVLDPTLLLSKKQWKEHIKLSRLHDEKYLLVYSVESSKQTEIINKVASQIAKERNLIVVGVYYGDNPIECCQYNHFRATPDIFLSLMYYSEYVVVSSFHGTAFSINFEKQFTTVAPARFNNRVENILQLTGLKSRLVSSITSEIDKNIIDYSKVSKIMKEKRSLSVKELSIMLNI